MTPDDRKLFEALCVAMAGGVLADQGVNPAMVRWSGIADAASDALSAIRAAEGEDATPEPERNCNNCKHRDLETYVSPCDKCTHAHYGTYASKWEPRDTQSVRTIVGGDGTVRDLTAEDTINGLRARLKEAESRCEVLLQELQHQWAAYQSDLDAADTIIHALCDERAMKRRLHHRTLMDYYRAGQQAKDAEAILANVRDIVVAKPWRLVFPVGYAPQRLEVGMVVGSKHLSRLVQIVRADECNAFDSLGGGWTRDSSSHTYDMEWTLAAPFEVPND